MVGFISANAKKYSYTFHNIPVSQALVELSKEHPDINVTFIYRELDKYTTSAAVDTDDINEALRLIIGFNPIMLSEKKGIHYVEALQHGKYVYTGKVIDSENEPIPGSSVYLINPKDSVVITYGATAHDGTFAIPCDKKNLTAKVSCIGYVTSLKKAVNYDVGTIVLRDNPILLTSLTIEAENVILSPDRYTYMPTQRQKQFSSTGFDLIRHMAIPTLITVPGSNTVTDVFGNKCEMFINFNPASNDDLDALNISNVRKIEVYDSPSDPRFRGARKAINIIVQEYSYGGYSKFLASETFLNGFSNKENVYNKFTFKRMTYDFYIGADNRNNKHTGENTESQYLLKEGIVSTTELTNSSKNIVNSFPLTFRASYNANRLQVQNLASYMHESIPEHSYSGQLFENSTNNVYSFKRNNISRSNSLNYSGSLYWWHPKDYAIDYSHFLSYDHRNNSSLYHTNSLNYPLNNNAIEDRAYIRLNLYALKALGSKHRIKLGGRFIYLNDDVDYLNDTESTDHLRTTTEILDAQYTFSTKNINLSANIGVGIERISANNINQKETTPFGSVNFSWKFNKKNNVSTYVSYGLWTPGIEMRQDVVVRDNEFLYLTGNPSLANYKELNTNIAYNFFLNNKFNLAAFAGYQESFNRVATVFIPYDESAIIRSFINDGNYLYRYFGVSANLKLFNNNLQLYANLTQKFYKTTGIYNTALNPVRIQIQATYYWKSFYALASWSNKNSLLTENSNIIIHGRPNYLVEAGWGNGTWVISLTAKNIFNSSWNSETWAQHTPLYNERKTVYNPSAHASIKLSVTYTIGYGKKTRRGNEISAPDPAPSAIIKH